jgi:hypothetical protein
MRRVKYSGTAGTPACADSGACKVLSHVAGNASAALHTATFRTINLASLEIQVNFTRVAGTALVNTCTCSKDMGATYGAMTTSAISAGAATDSALVDTITTSTTGNWTFPALDVRRCDYVQCVLAVTSGGATDFTDTYAIASVGQ